MLLTLALLLQNLPLRFRTGEPGRSYPQNPNSQLDFRRNQLSPLLICPLLEPPSCHLGKQRHPRLWGRPGLSALRVPTSPDIGQPCPPVSLDSTPAHHIHVPIKPCCPLPGGPHGNADPSPQRTKPARSPPAQRSSHGATFPEDKIRTPRPDLQGLARSLLTAPGLSVTTP